MKADYATLQRELHGVPEEVLERHLGYLLDSQRNAWKERSVAMLLVGRSAASLFESLEPMYTGSGLKVRKVYAEQSDAPEDERKIKITDGSLMNEEEVLCLFDNTIREGDSMAGAMMGIFRMYGDGVAFHQTYLMALKDGMGIAHFPLGVVLPERESLGLFIRKRRPLREAIENANKRAGRPLLASHPPDRERIYLRLDAEGGLLPPTDLLSTEAIERIVDEACRTAAGVEVGS